MKTQTELNLLKQEIQSLDKKLKELTPEELKSVVSGFCFDDGLNDTTHNLIEGNVNLNKNIQSNLESIEDEQGLLKFK